jgi:hypothetical protein
LSGAEDSSPIALRHSGAPDICACSRANTFSAQAKMFSWREVYRPPGEKSEGRDLNRFQAGFAALINAADQIPMIEKVEGQ